MGQCGMFPNDHLAYWRREPQSGTARAALRHRDFRLLWSGVLISNIGTWMQNVLLGAFGWTLTHSTFFVGVLFFAQLGPVLVLAPLGGLLADDFSRRRVVILTQAPQFVAAIVLAVIAFGGVTSPTMVALLVLIIGIFNALSMPAVLASLPGAVPAADLDGAVSLTTMQMNLSRVVGPAIGAALYALTNASAVFTLNALTYVVLMVAFAVARLAPRPPKSADPFLHRLSGGFRLVKTDPVIRRVLGMMVTFSLLCLPFIGLMPAIAAKQFQLDPKSLAYGLLIATLGIGAVIGSLSVGSIFAQMSRQRLMVLGFAGFSLAVFALAFVSTLPLAYPLVAFLGVTYFATVTALSNVLQRSVTESLRGRVTALWMMSFGGTVPIGVLLFGAIAQSSGLMPVLLVSAGCALVLAAVALYFLRTTLAADV
ncbi:MAG: MFS transporter [Acidimicrobiia bacterium]